MKTKDLTEMIQMRMDGDPWGKIEKKLNLPKGAGSVYLGRELEARNLKMYPKFVKEPIKGAVDKHREEEERFNKMLRMRLQGETYDAIAEEFGTSHNNIIQILNNGSKKRGFRIKQTFTLIEYA